MQRTTTATRNIRSFLTCLTMLAIGIAGAQVPSYVPTNGLVAWWSFDGNADDLSGNANHGAVNGAVPTANRFGAPNQAYLFDGTSSYIHVPSSPSLESPSSAFTVTAWVNSSGMSLVGTSPFNPILVKSDNSGNAFMYRFAISDNAGGFFAGTNNWTNNAGAATQLNLGEWYLLTITLDGDSAHAFRNGLLVNSLPFVANMTLDNRPLNIGRDVPGVTEVFNGSIDDIGIWNRALTSAEVEQLFLGGTVSQEEHSSVPVLRAVPNPSSGLLQVRATGHGPDTAGAINVRDMVGRVLLTARLKNGLADIDLSTAPRGVYIIEVSGAVGRSPMRVVLD